MRFLQIPDATIYLLGCFILLFFSFQRALAAPCRVHVHDSRWCLGTAALKGAVPRSRACQFRTHQRKETTQRSAAEYRRPSFTFGSFPAYPPSSRITNTRVTGYRTLAALASDSPPRASVIASRVPRPGAPRPAETGRDRPRRAARSRETRQPSPVSGSLRRSSHFGSRSAPSRAALLAWLTVASSWAFPLDRALCGRPAASVAERSSETGRHY